jgi:uncharacterized protein YdeI (BOF family)
MAEPYRDRDSNAPPNPPSGVVNPDAQRKAFRRFVTPTVAFFAVVGILLVYFTMRPNRGHDDRGTPEAEATTGFSAPRAETPGGKEPNPNPSSTSEDIQTRNGEPITELHSLFYEGVQAIDDRRVEVKGVTVERVDSPALFWVRDGNARVAVVAPAAGPQVSQGQTIDLSGSVQRTGNEIRIRASRIEVNK